VSDSARYDLAIIGGGVNGCGIARDAAGRGAKVLLLEARDLAGQTSSASTKLIHGGLRYLEHGAFRLVHEALQEREILWRMAPHIIQPLRFVLPVRRGLRPIWLIRAGLFVYDHLGGSSALPATHTIDLAHDPTGVPLQDGFSKAFEYSDCRVDDSRLVVLNAMDAAERGARILTQCVLTAAQRQADGWTLRGTHRDGKPFTASARILINAAGPHVGDILRLSQIWSAPKVRLVQGSHIVVPRLYAHDRAYIFQNTDRRVVFAIPYQDRFTMIGTTDHDFQGSLDDVSASAEDIAYLCAAAGRYFKTPVHESDIVWSFSGVRALVDDGAARAQETTRDYVLHLDVAGGLAPMLSIVGGKLTTYRRLAESALQRLGPYLPPSAHTPWTAQVPLPGGDFPRTGLGVLTATLQGEYPFLAPAHTARLARSYGTRARLVLADAKTAEDLGRVFGADLTLREVEYLRNKEWARSAEDILWRRSKLGLFFSPPQKAALMQHLEDHPI
jgi:glycerol-3-phosphate dehydrogenase